MRPVQHSPHPSVGTTRFPAAAVGKMELLDACFPVALYAGDMPTTPISLILAPTSDIAALVAFILDVSGLVGLGEAPVVVPTFAKCTVKLSPTQETDI